MWVGDLGFGETVTIVRPGVVTGEDDYGNPILGPDVEIAVEGCAFAPATSDESTDVDGKVVVTPASIYAGKGAPFREDDVVRVRGDDGWYVDGEPQLWLSPWGAPVEGVRVYVRRRS